MTHADIPQHVWTAIFYLVLSGGLTAALIWIERQTPSRLTTLVSSYLTEDGYKLVLKVLPIAKLYGWLFNGFILACSLDHLSAFFFGQAAPITSAIATIEAIISGVTAFLFVVAPVYMIVKKRWK